jgi:long-chain acyl-CoA synthetase
LHCARLATSGGAALPLDTLAWYRRLGLNLVEGYGMTETGITHTPRLGRSRPGYVGDGLDCMETRIAENGEILIKSPMNMLGYYRDPESTRQAFTEDGFFRTGDLGEVDAEGWLKITGRVKEQFKTTKGKYVSPSRIEKLLSVHPAIEGCCVMGSGMASTFAVAVITKESAESVEVRENLDRSLQALLEQVNAQLEAHERLGFLVVTGEPWTIANGFLTPTMKQKRTVLEQHYSAHFDQWARQKGPIIWHAGGHSASA